MKSGIINVHKEAGFTSFDVVAKLRGILHIRKIGHTGTLDPDATGVLPVCIGKATKVCDMLTNTDKTYEATLLMGVSTDTYDISGKVINRSEVKVTPQEVENTIMSFVGEIEQIPPMYSAIKVNGKKLYELAREGKVIDRKPRKVTIYNIEETHIDLPRVTFKVKCSKGTYIRSLCNDIGEKLGCFGCMENLVRSKVGDFELEDALYIEEIERLAESGKIEDVILGIDEVFNDYTKLHINEQSIKKCLNGGRLSVGDVVESETNQNIEGEMYRIYLPNDVFVGIYKKNHNDLILEKMFYDSI